MENIVGYCLLTLIIIIVIGMLVWGILVKIKVRKINKDFKEKQEEFWVDENNQKKAKI